MAAQKGQFYDGSGGSVYHWEEFVSGPKVSPSRCGLAFRGFFRRLNVLSCNALNKRKIRSFPTNLIAGIFGFERATFFEVPEEKQEVPKVKF